VTSLSPVLSLFIDLNTVLTPRLSVSRFLAIVPAATRHTCELQFRPAALGLSLADDRLVNAYGHSSSNRSRICRCTSDSMSAEGAQHSPLPTKLNLRRIMSAHYGTLSDDLPERVVRPPRRETKNEKT